MKNMLRSAEFPKYVSFRNYPCVSEEAIVTTQPCLYGGIQTILRENK